MFPHPKRRSAPGVALALLTSLAAGPASAVVTNFSDDVETAIDRGIAWHDAQGHLNAVNNSCGEGAGLAALAVLEKRRDASQNALSQGWAFANAADRTRIENVVTFVATRAAQPLAIFNYRDGADAMALSLYLRTSGPDANNLSAPNLPLAAAGLAAATDRLLQNQQPVGYWCYVDVDPNGCPDSSVTQLAIAGLAAARATFLTPAFSDPGRVASIDAALQLTSNLYATNNHVGALEPGELAHGYQGARPDLGWAGSGGSLQQTASGTWAMLVGGRTVNDAPVQSYLRWMRNRFRYTDLTLDGEGWIHSLRYFMWSATKSFRLIETAGNALPGMLTPADVGGLDPVAAPAYGPRQPHLDPNTVARPASFGAGGAGYYADPDEPARWYFDFAYTLLTHQDLNAGAPADFGYFVPPANVANGTLWNPCADQAWALLVLERALGGLCLDDDGDGICNDEDDCPQEADPDQVDANENGIGDACETCCGLPAAAPVTSSVQDCVSGGGQLLPPAACCVDTDADGVCDAVDNCVDDPNPNQADSNENGIGDACESGCCRLPDGTVLTLDYEKCLNGQGVIEPAEVCEEIVCCQPHAGGPASLVPFSECRFGEVAVVDDLLCCASEMCCLLPGDALETTLYADCVARNGVSVPQALCETPVCCRQGDGHYAELSPHDCAAAGGAPAVALPGGPAEPAAYCVDTCCRAPEVGFVTLSVGDCLGAQGLLAEPASCQHPICCGTEQGAQLLAPLNCEAAGGAALDAVWCEDICCRGIGPAPITANRLDCVQQGGIVVDAEACSPAICCALPEGNLAELSPAACAQQGGNPTAQEKCDSVVCCITAAGAVSYAGVADCLAAGGRVDAQGAACEKEVCCRRADGTTVIAPFSACVAGGGTETGADACAIGAIGCCAFRDGSVVFMDVARCLDSGGAQTEIAACQREVCCALPGQRAAYAQASACTEGGGVTVADALCQPPVEVCCLYRDGTTAFRLLQDCVDGGGLRVGVAECQAAPICCDLPDRTAYALSDTTCTTQQGAVTAENYCAGPICCMLQDGTSETTTLGACEAQRGRALVDVSCALDVCCETRGGASFADPAACAGIGGMAVADNSCLQPACCDTGGVLSRVTPPVCTRGGGTRVDDARCDRPACCETSPEVFEVNTALGCPAEVSMRVCLTLDAAAALRVGNNPLTDPATAAPAARQKAGCATTAGAPAGLGALAAFALLGLSLAPRRRRAARAGRQEMK